MRGGRAGPIVSILILAGFLLVHGAVGDPARADQPAPDGWEQVMADGAPITITVEHVEILGGELAGLALRGAWTLENDHFSYGGFSGLLVSGEQFIALSDKGRWLGASMILEGDDLRLVDARRANMRDGKGRRYPKNTGDSEDLTRLGSRLVVSFERDHRIMFLGDNGRMGGTITSPEFEQFSSNTGLEALATLPDGRLITFSEGADGDGVPMFLIDQSGVVTEFRLPSVGAHSVTGADVGPDGRLYLILRDFSLFYGLSIRVMRYSLGPDFLPLPESAETLAAFEADSGIDNMEGISLDRGPGGDIRLWLISDNNFRSSQRTLLMQFDVLP